MRHVISIAAVAACLPLYVAAPAQAAPRVTTLELAACVKLAADPTIVHDPSWDRFCAAARTPDLIATANRDIFARVCARFHAVGRPVPPEWAATCRKVGA